MKQAAPPPSYPQLDPLDGMVKRHNHLRIGQYHQHLTELLPEDMSPLQVGWLAGCWWWAQVAGRGGFRVPVWSAYIEADVAAALLPVECAAHKYPPRGLLLFLYMPFSAVLPQGVWPRPRGGEDALRHRTFWHHRAAAGAPRLCDNLPSACLLLASRPLACLPAICIVISQASIRALALLYCHRRCP